MKTLKGSFPPDKLLQLFQAFVAKVYPDVAPDSQQYKELRMMFFAGAHTGFECMEDTSEHPNEDVCVARLELLHREMSRELADFAEHCKLRVAMGEKIKQRRAN